MYLAKSVPSKIPVRITTSRCSENIVSWSNSTHVNNNIDISLLDYGKPKKQTLDNLVPLVKVTDYSLLKCGLANCRSVRNKAENICDLIVENNLDCLALTETWLSANEEENQAVISGLMPSNCNYGRCFFHISICYHLPNSSIYEKQNSKVYFH